VGAGVRGAEVNPYKMMDISEVLETYLYCKNLELRRICIKLDPLYQGKSDIQKAIVAYEQLILSESRG